jgi:hypothetical protein
VLDRRRFSYIITGALVATLTCTVRPAQAGEGSHSDSKSDNSSEGSKGSDDSSRTSGDSSKRSGASSEDSGHGSKNSTDNSPRNSSRWTTDESSKGKTATTVSVAALIVVVGAAVLSGVLATRNSRRQDQQKAQALAKFLQRNHALVARDVVTGEGPMLGAWGRALGLSAGERERLGVVLVGSPEQGELLAALDGGMDEGRARRFAVGFTRLGRRALGQERFREIALAAGR